MLTKEAQQRRAIEVLCKDKMLPLPIPDVTAHTRKGLFAHDTPTESPDENNKKGRVFLQLFKCYKDTRRGLGERI